MQKTKSSTRIGFPPHQDYGNRHNLLEASYENELNKIFKKRIKEGKNINNERINFERYVQDYNEKDKSVITPKKYSKNIGNQKRIN